MESAIDNFGDLGVISKGKLALAYRNFKANGGIVVHERTRESKITDIPESLYEPLINKMNVWYTDASTAIVIAMRRSFRGGWRTRRVAYMQHGH